MALTLKNLCIFLLAGIILYPVGINQSFAQSPVPDPMPAVGEALNLSGYSTIDASCLIERQLILSSTNVFGSLGTLSSVPCFEGNLRTWQNYILNADDVIVRSNTPATASIVGNGHSINIRGLEPNTDYKSVWLLTGAYSASPGTSPYVDSTIYRIVSFTTLAPPIAEIRDTLDLTGYSTIDESCLGELQLILSSTNVFGSLGALVQSPAPCFEGNTRTWQAYILNANDNTVVISKTPVTTSAIGSSSTNRHAIDFRGLESNTDYRAVLFLTGAYSANPGSLDTSPYTDSTVYRIVPFTTESAPIAVVGGTLDLTGYSTIDESCLEINRLTSSSTGTSGSLGALVQSQIPCFEGNTRTWQAYILNANDNTVVKSGTPVSTSTITSSSTDRHFISFSNLESNTDYRAVLFLTGAYSASPGTSPYVDSTIYRLVSFTTESAPIAVVGGTLDLMGYTEIEESCLEGILLNYRPTRIFGSLGTLVQSPAPCFEGNARTWQAYILNANDNTVVKSGTPVSTSTITSSSTDTHFIRFSNLESNTDYRAVLFLTGAYSANPGSLGTSPYTDSTVYRVIPFTTHAPIAAVGGTIDLSRYGVIEESCLQINHPRNTVPVGIDINLDTLVQSPASCFEGNLHTWYGYILNAADDTVVYSTFSVTTSTLTGLNADTHRILFDGLEPDTNYKAVWLFTGAYSANPSDLGASPYVTTSVYRIVPFTTEPAPIAAVGGTLDLTGYSTIDESCLGENQITPSSTGTSGSLGTLVQSPAPCFEDNTRTWQAYILNANDNTVVKSKTPVTTSAIASSFTDTHFIRFSNLESNTDYRAVLFLTGAYSANPGTDAYVADTSVYRIVPFTTLAPPIAAVGGTLDLTGYSTIDESCLGENQITPSSTGTSGSLGTLVQSPAPCFEDNTRVWESYLLNAVTNNIVYSSHPVTTSTITSSFTDTHFIHFSGLESNTNYRIILFLTGAYSANPGTDAYVADTSVYRIVPFTTEPAPIAAVGGTLDLMGYTEIEESCLEENQLNYRPTTIGGSLGTLVQSPAPCFEDNTRTWQAYLLNAADNTVVNVKTPVSTSTITSSSIDRHFIHFSGLESNTNYRIILFLTGAYSANPGTSPYVPTTVFYISNELDLSTHTNINASCLGENTANHYAFEIIGSLGALSTEPCFEDNTRTWEIYILNAVTNNIVYSSHPVTTSSVQDMHEINFNGLEPNTSYRSVLLLNGAYSGGSGSSYTDSTVYRVTSFTTTDALAIGETLDLMGYDPINASCLEHYPSSITSTTITNPPGQPSAPCFEDNTRTWQAYLLNADNDIIVDFKNPVTTSSVNDWHQTRFTGLEPNTNYRTVLLLTGAYNGDGGSSYTDSTVYRILSFTTLLADIGDDLDLMGYDNINASCLGENTANLYTFAIVGSLGALSTEPCFEDNTRTWEIYILNAVTNNIVYSSHPVTTSSVQDIHEIDFNGLEPNTSYRSVLLLNGAYNGGSGSYADTSVSSITLFTTRVLPPVDNTLPTIGDDLDLSEYANFNLFCTDRLGYITTPTGIEHSLGQLSSTVKCFEDNVRTWQALILNADDDVIVASSDPVTTASLKDIHEIDFDALEPETDYRVVLLFTGAYSASPDFLEDFPYTDTSVFGIYPFTTDESDSAPDITLQALTGSAGTLDISFSELFGTVDIHRYSDAISDRVPAYADSDITLSLQTADASIYDSITGATGVTVDPGNTGSRTPFIVNADTVTIDTGLDSAYNSDIHFDYTVTGNNGPFDGYSNSGVLTITFVDVISNVLATPYTFIEGSQFIPSLTPIFESGIQPYLFTALYIPELYQDPEYDVSCLNCYLGRASLQHALRDITLTTTGTSNASGTLSFADASSGSSATGFVYIPAPGFIGTETFPYTATFRGETSSSVFHFVVPEPVCAASLRSGVAFGTLDVGETSDVQFIVVNNDGNRDVQLFMKGDDWKSVADDTVIMNVGQTKYTGTGNPFESYADKTALTSTPTNLLFVLPDRPIAFTMQLHMDLLDDTFRGPLAQELTLSNVCDEGTGIALPPPEE